MTLPELIRWYYRTRDSASAPGVDFVDSTGRMYSEACGSCGWKTRHQNAMKAFVCAHCGDDWHYDDRYLLKGEVQTSPRAGAFERANAKLVQVGYVLSRQLGEQLWKWDTRIYIATAMGHPINDEFAPAFKETFITAPGPWSRRSLFTRASRAKEELTRRMALAEVGLQQ